MLTSKRLLQNRKGMASLEMIPVIIVVAILLNFTLGFYGIVQTGILNSIAARNYAFETFRHRSNLVYFHDVRGNGTSNFLQKNLRLHGIASENRGADVKTAIATTRNIGFGSNPDSAGTQDTHEGGRGIATVVQGMRDSDIDVSPVWIRPMYGICLNSTCKPN